MIRVVAVSGFESFRTPMLLVRGIVFDLDGVLVDSRDGWVEAERAAVADLGGQWVPRTPGSRSSPDTTKGITDLARRCGLHGLEVELAHAVASTIGGVFSRHLHSVPGARQALERILELVPVAVATNTPRHLSTLMLEITELESFVSALVCSDDVGRYKPAPNVFAVACAKLGLGASDCVGIDDTVDGVRSALDAGLAALAFGTKAVQDERVSGLLHRLDDLNVECQRA